MCHTDDGSVTVMYMVQLLGYQQQVLLSLSLPVVHCMHAHIIFITTMQVNTLYVKLLVVQQFSNSVFTSNGSRHVYGAASLHSRPADVVQRRISCIQ